MTPKTLQSLKVVQIPGKGRGVVATERIWPGRIIDRSPVVSFPLYHLNKESPLQHYTFFWRNSTSAVALGIGSLFNHSSKPNADWDCDLDYDYITFKALKNIYPGQEITVYYGYGPSHIKKLDWYEK